MFVVHGCAFQVRRNEGRSLGHNNVIDVDVVDGNARVGLFVLNKGAVGQTLDLERSQVRWHIHGNSIVGFAIADGAKVARKTVCVGFGNARGVSDNHVFSLIVAVADVADVAVNVVCVGAGHGGAAGSGRGSDDWWL